MRTLRPVRPPVAIEREYHKKIRTLLQEMDRSLFWWLRAEYRKAEPEIVGDSAMGDLRAKLKKLVRKWMKTFSDKAEDIAQWFADKVQAYTTGNLQRQFNNAKLAQLGFNLKFTYHSRHERDIFRSIVEQNVNLIKSIASEHLTRVEGVVLRGIETGHDLSRMTDDLESAFGVSERRAAMIARDQTAKATNNLSRQRLLDYGVTKGKWMHTASGKTYRESHVEMDGTIYDIEEGCYDDDYGDYIQPGELVNCRCVCIPVLDFSKEDELYSDYEGTETGWAADSRIKDFNENHDPGNGQFTSGSGGSGVGSSESTSESSGSKATSGKDVKTEYTKNATPGHGKLSTDKNYDVHAHKTEIETADFLHNTFGGDIHLLTESKTIGEKTPDCNWNGKSWDFKTLSTEKSADSAVRYGLKQIEANPGGLVLLCSDKNMSVEKIESIVDRRMYRSNKKSADIIIVRDGKVESIKRHKK